MIFKILSGCACAALLALLWQIYALMKKNPDKKIEEIEPALTKKLNQAAVAVAIFALLRIGAIFF